MQAAYEKARLAEMLTDMSTSVNDYAELKSIGSARTGAAASRLAGNPPMSPIKEIPTEEKAQPHRERPETHLIPDAERSYDEPEPR